MDQELPHPTYDTLFKRMLQDRNRAKAFIRACVPPELAKLITKAPQPQVSRRRNWRKTRIYARRQLYRDYCT